MFIILCVLVVLFAFLSGLCLADKDDLNILAVGFMTLTCVSSVLVWVVYMHDTKPSNVKRAILERMSDAQHEYSVNQENLKEFN